MALPNVPDVYRITLVQMFVNQEIINVFHYRDAAVSPWDTTVLATAFWNHIKATLRAWMPVSANYTTIRVDAEYLDGARPFGSYTVPVGEQQGLRSPGTNDFLPPTLAAAIRLNVGTRTTRPGSKRIAGLLENDILVSTIQPTQLALLQAFADVIDIPFDAAGPGTPVTPVIVGYPGPRNPVGVRVQDVTSAIAQQLVSHQVSRDQRTS